MRSQLILIHRARNEKSDQAFQLDPSWVVWETCIRRIAIGYKPQRQMTSHFSDLGFAQDEILQGKQAYKFLLEIVCGLHSPVCGETEVHGQFREFLNQVGESNPCYKVLHQVHVDARRVREAHLRGLGSQSYGSLARRKLKKYKKVVMLGAGQLAREILPWLIKQDIEVEIYVRDPQKHLDLIKNSVDISVRSFSEAKNWSSGDGALLILAPMTSEHIESWLGNDLEKIDLILDYRGESVLDPLQNYFGDYYTLKNIFVEIENTKQKVEAEVGRARELIHSISL